MVLVELSPLRTTLEDRYLSHGAAEVHDDPDHPRRAAAPRPAPHLLVAAAPPLVFAVVATLTVFSVGRGDGRRGPGAAARRWPRRTGDGGGTEAFAVGASFAGFFVFVTFIALIAAEFSGGTFRALLLRDPHRLRVIVGKLAGILLVAAGAVALVEACTFALSLVVAPAQDIATAAWFSLASLGEPAATTAP